MVGQDSTVLAVGAGGGYLDIFPLSVISLLSAFLSVGDGTIWTESR